MEKAGEPDAAAAFVLISQFYNGILLYPEGAGIVIELV